MHWLRRTGAQPWQGALGVAAGPCGEQEPECTFKDAPLKRDSCRNTQLTPLRGPIEFSCSAILETDA